jgi:hypothetical protein
MRKLLFSVSLVVTIIMTPLFATAQVVLEASIPQSPFGHGAPAFFRIGPDVGEFLIVVHVEGLVPVTVPPPVVPPAPPVVPPIGSPQAITSETPKSHLPGHNPELISVSVSAFGRSATVAPNNVQIHRYDCGYTYANPFLPQLTVDGTSEITCLVPFTDRVYRGFFRSSPELFAGILAGGGTVRLTLSDGTRPSTSLVPVPGSEVLFQNTSNGRVAAWSLAGTRHRSTTVLPVAPAGSKLVGTGDFNGDGQNDLVWQGSDRKVAVWYMNGLVFGSVASGPAAPPSWFTAGVADFNNDSHPDLLLQNSLGGLAIWTMGGPGGVIRQSAHVITQTDSQLRVTGVADFNRDGNEDILFQNSNGEVSVWFMTGRAPFRKSSARVMATVSPVWRVAGTADFDGNGYSDLLFQNGGAMAVWLMGGADGTTRIASAWLPATTPAWQVRATK